VRNIYELYDETTVTKNGRDNGVRTEEDDFYTRHRGRLLRGVMAEDFLSYAHGICHAASSRVR